MTDENFGGAAIAENDDWRNRYEESKMEETKYRVWCVINPPRSPTYTPVESPKAGREFIEKEARKQLKDDTIWMNAFGLEVFEDGEWSEWYDEFGNDIDAAEFEDD
jgi:hypothetical protein